MAAEIRRLRKPDPYKQKGIRYVGEVLKKKAGKAGAVVRSGDAVAVPGTPRSRLDERENQAGRRDRIKIRLRKKIVGSPERPRLTVFRSGAHIYVQAVDDATGTTVAAASSLDPDLKAKMGEKGAAGTSRRTGDRPDHRERLSAKGLAAGGLRPRRLPVPRAHQGAGRRRPRVRAEGRALGVIE